MYEKLIVETDARGVARVTIDRPEVGNAFDDGLMRELADAFRALDRDGAVRVVVLTGAGKVFCAGGDIAWMRGTAAAARPERIAGGRLVADMLWAINDCSKAVIARVNGAAFGGGVGLACASDVTVAVQSARFALSEVRIGLIPANIAPFVVRRIGEANARRFGLSGRVFSAAEAVGIGLVHSLATDDELDAAVEAEIAHFLQAAPEAIARTKTLFAYVARHGDEAIKEYTPASLADAWESACGREGIAAFLEKRTPPWQP
jgi:methylglutaconyl-CoA hydratase